MFLLKKNSVFVEIKFSLKKMDVYALIIKLCSELVKENDCEELSIKAAKKIAFENLLKKSFDKSFNDCEKVLKELQFIQFELSLSKRTEDIESIDSYIELFKSNSNELHSITALLCSLKNFESKPAFFSEVNSVAACFMALCNIF